MEEEYDVIVCGTGLKECILSGLLSVHGKKVLHVDRNGYYGGESASLNITNLFEQLGDGGQAPSSLGPNRDWNVDLVPKFVMSGGNLVKILLLTGVSRYLEWQVIDCSYVYQHQAAGWVSGEKWIHKVPATEKEILLSPMLGIMDKTRCQQFFSYVSRWSEKDQGTWKGFDAHKQTMRELYSYYKLEGRVKEFIGHTVALYTNDDYVDEPIGQTLKKIKLYMDSFARFGKSPFLYPVYGLGGLPEGFSRLSAIHGGTYMLNQDVAGVLFDASGKVTGIKDTEGKVARCKMLVCDPSYVTDMPRLCDDAATRKLEKVKPVGKVIRAVCLCSAPISETGDCTSCQVIIPQEQLKRKNDIYITMISASHGVARKGFYVIMISTAVETADPEAEITPALALLNKVHHKFIRISDIYEPLDNGIQDQLFVTSSIDATSHFESATADVLRVWRNITGADLDLDQPPKTPATQEST